MAIMKKPLTKSQYPKTVSGIIDTLEKMRAAKSFYAAIATEFADAERLFEEHVINTFEKSKLEGAKSKTHQLSISRVDVPSPKDWKKIWAHIKKTGETDLVQKRLSSTAVRARWKDNKKVPGVEKFTKIGLSLTKVTKKK